MRVHVLQIAGDGDFFYRILDFSVLYPEACRAARLVSCDVIYTLPEQFGDKQTTPHFL